MKPGFVRPGGILAAVAASALTASTSWAEEEPLFTPVAPSAPISAAPAGSALPWLAQPSNGASFTAPERSQSSRTVWLVLPALALGGGALYLRLSKRKAASLTPSRRLEVLDTARVGPKAHVVMIYAGGRQLLLGVTEQSVQRLAWIPADRAPEAAQSTQQPAPEQPVLHEGPFAHILRSFTHGKEPVVNEPSDPAIEIAAETKDFIERRATLALGPARQQEREPAAQTAAGESPASADIEGQVSGLRKRRSGKLG